MASLAPYVIMVAGGSHVGALQQATRTVPIVFVQVTDPVPGGFIAQRTLSEGLLGVEMDARIALNSLALGRLLTRHALYRPRHPAVVFGNERLTYLQFNNFVNRWANALAGLGVGRGDRVATILPNSLELLATYWACAKLGAAAVPLSPLLLTAGFVSLLNDARPSGRGRDGDFSPPPAQIPAGAANAPGSHLG